MKVFSTRRIVAAAAAAASLAALAAASSPAVSATASSAASGGTLNIGVIYPFTGANASQGAVGLAGCLVGVAPVNAAGGVLGKKFVCKSFDTKGDPADAVPAANQMLASANPVMVIGASDDAVATAPIVTAAHIVNFATIGDPHFDNQTNPYFYRLTPSDALQGKALGYYAATHGLTHAAAAFTSDLGAQTSVPPLRTEYKKLGHKLVADLTLAPGASSYRTEVEQVINAHPNALITEMDPQSQATFMSEYQQLAGHLPLTIGTERTATSDVLGALRSSLGVANMQKYIKTITPYVGLTGVGYTLYKKTLAGLASKIPNASQYIGHPYTISDFDAVTITALAMNEAHSTSPAVYNKFVVKVTAPSKGATVVHTYAEGLAALKAKKTIQYMGASGPLVFDKYHSAGRSFSYDKYDAPTKSMVPVTVIPGTALNG